MKIVLVFLVLQNHYYWNHLLQKALIKKILIPKYTDIELKKNLQKKDLLPFKLLKN